jgi:Na+/H+ antiporter
LTSPLLAAGLVIALATVTSRSLARRTGIAYPVFLVLAGAVASLIPHVPAVQLRPSVVFLGFLPPLVYHAGVLTSPRELRRNALPIGLGALGLVVATTFAVAATTSLASPRFGWAAAFVLGAVVAPTDPVAATSVLNRVGAPPGLTLILEGESLVNDGVALALFSLGVAGLSRPGSIAGGFVEFLRIAGGGTLFGLAAGWLISYARRALPDAASQVVVSLVVPYIVYLPANSLGLSGVLATLTSGLVLGQRHVAGLEPSGRLRESEFWEVLTFLLESVLFVLVGLQFRHTLNAMSGYSPLAITLVAGLCITTVVVVRTVWWALLPNLRWRPEGRLLDTGNIPWRHRAVLGWSGLRGAISLAAALSVPSVVDGHRFTGRNVVVFSTFCVIVFTLLGQGTSLPLVLRWLGIGGAAGEARERALANRRLAEVALARLDQLVSEEDIPDGVSDMARRMYERRLARARQELDDQGSEKGTAKVSGPSLAALENRLLEPQYQALARLHRNGRIRYSVMRSLRRELDLRHASSAHR